jgi:hypothetical protein
MHVRGVTRGLSGDTVHATCQRVHSPAGERAASKVATHVEIIGLVSQLIAQSNSFDIAEMD